MVCTEHWSPYQITWSDVLAITVLSGWSSAPVAKCYSVSWAPVGPTTPLTSEVDDPAPAADLRSGMGPGLGVNFGHPLHYKDPAAAPAGLGLVIRIDSLLGGGVPPTVRLQRALRDRTRVTPLDRAVAGVYGSWLLPHMILGWILLRHPEFIPRAAG